MTWFSGTFTFLIVWWIVLFAVLPWGVRRVEEPEPGHEAGAPEKPMLWRKALVTTVIAAVIWCGIYWFIESGLVSFRPN